MLSLSPPRRTSGGDDHRDIGTPQQYAQLGLNDPLYVQYGRCGSRLRCVLRHLSYQT